MTPIYTREQINRAFRGLGTDISTAPSKPFPWALVGLLVVGAGVGVFVGIPIGAFIAHARR